MEEQNKQDLVRRRAFCLASDQSVDYLSRLHFHRKSIPALFTIRKQSYDINIKKITT